MVKPDWQKGEPSALATGMLIRLDTGQVMLVGEISDSGNYLGESDCSFVIIEWAWAIKPHELEWLSGKEAK